MHVCARTYMNTCTHTQALTHTHTRTHARMHARMYAHARTHTYTHTHTHTKGVVLLSICQCQFLHLAAHLHLNLTVCKQIFRIIFYNYFPMVRSVMSDLFRAFLTNRYKSFMLPLPLPHPRPPLCHSLLYLVYFFCLYVA